MPTIPLLAPGCHRGKSSDGPTSRRRESFDDITLRNSQSARESNATLQSLCIDISRRSVCRTWPTCRPARRPTKGRLIRAVWSRVPADRARRRHRGGSSRLSGGYRRRVEPDIEVRQHRAPPQRRKDPQPGETSEPESDGRPPSGASAALGRRRMQGVVWQPSWQPRHSPSADVRRL
jgi:hypothetical protein